MTPDLTAIAGRHVRNGDWCEGCANSPWPCDDALLARRIGELTEVLRELADHHGKEHTSFAGCSLVDIHVNRALAKSRDTL